MVLTLPTFFGYVHIQSFWGKAGQLISRVIGFNIDVSLAIMFVGVTPEGLNKCDNYLLKMFLVECKKAVTKCWLKRSPPDMF